MRHASKPRKRIAAAGISIFLALVLLGQAARQSGIQPSPTETALAPLTPAKPALAEVPEATKQQVVETYGKLPPSFEANQGQTDPQVKFLSRGRGYSLSLTSTEAAKRLMPFQLLRPEWPSLPQSKLGGVPHLGHSSTGKRQVSRSFLLNKGGLSFRRIGKE